MSDDEVMAILKGEEPTVRAMAQIGNPVAPKGLEELQRRRAAGEAVYSLRIGGVRLGF